MSNTDNDAVAPASAWGWVLAYGAIMLLTGLFAFLNPVATGIATGILIGALLLIYGILAVIAGLSSLSRRARWTELLLGLLGIVAGAVTIFNPFAGALSLVLLIGAWLVVSGLLEIISALKARHDRGWRLVLGVVDVALGGFLLFSSPASGLVFLAFCVGISFLFRGVFLIILALGLRKIGHA